MALQLDTHIEERHVVGEREHTSILVPMIGDLLRETGTAIPELDAIILGNGPGSFIGMRIGAAVAQGLCYGAGLKLVPVSSLAAVAAETIDKHGADRVLVAQDARMHEVYLGQFRRDADGLPQAVDDEELHSIGAIEGLDEKYVAAGGAWEKFPKLLEENRGRIQELAAISLPRARYLLACGGRVLREGGAISPDALVPSYIRVKVAAKPAPAGV